jgi:hypothetical protein
MARYREIAEDMRARIAAGQWSIGQRLPTLDQLQQLYRAGVNTVRDAQRLLVVEGLLRRDREAGGIVVVAVPTTRGAPATPPPPVRTELLALQQAVARMLAQLPEELPTLPYVIDEKRQPRPLLQFIEEQTAAYPGRAWAPMRGWRCATCGIEGGQDRGWSEPAIDELHQPRRRARRGSDVDATPPPPLPPEACVAEKHSLTRWYGPDPAGGGQLTRLDELELERNAHLHETARLLGLISPDPAVFAGYLAAGRWHAAQAAKLSRKLSGVT